MKKSLNFLFLAIIFIITNSSCASILSDSSYLFTVNTTPSGLNVVIQNNKGAEIYKGDSPATVMLEASTGFFKKASYIVIVSGEGYKEKTIPINFTIDGWYFGNLLFGGLIGFLIIDPLTGAMYKIETEYMNVTLSKETVNLDRPSLKVYDVANIPTEWKDKLVRINP